MAVSALATNALLSALQPRPDPRWWLGAGNGVLCFHRPRYHARTDPRRVARGCDARGLSDDTRERSFVPSPAAAAAAGGWQKDHAENLTGARGQGGLPLAATTSIRRSHCPVVTCSDRALTSPSLGPPPARASLFILNFGVNTVAYSNAGATLCPAIRR